MTSLSRSIWRAHLEEAAAARKRGDLAEALACEEAALIVLRLVLAADAGKAVAA